MLTSLHNLYIVYRHYLNEQLLIIVLKNLFRLHFLQAFTGYKKIIISISLKKKIQKNIYKDSKMSIVEILKKIVTCLCRSSFFQKPT